MIYSLDIETACAVEECPHIGTSCKCDHALHHLKNKILSIGLYNGTEFKYFLTIESFKDYLQSSKEQLELIGQNLKFDLKTLLAKGIDLINMYHGDTQVLASVILEKIPKEYLDNYEHQRVKINKELKMSHRKCGPNSLKILAPFWLGVKPFWETDDKTDIEYLKKDCIYTYRLFFKLKEQAQREGHSWRFYEKKLMNYQRTILDIELNGVKIDRNGIIEYKKECEEKIIKVKEELDKEWDIYYREWIEEEKAELRAKYTAMAVAQIEKKPAKENEILEKYDILYLKALDKSDFSFNLASPKQKLWLFKRLGLDTEIELWDKEEGDFVEKETTGKFLINKYKNRKDIALFKEWQDLNKILTSFIPTYLDVAVDDRIYCSFNIDGARTGRLSCSNPNLQQVPRQMKKYFVASDNKKLVSYDYSAIEPYIIAYYSEDSMLNAILLNDKMDFHGEAARAFFPHVDVESGQVKKSFPKERDAAKRCDLSLMYGAGINRLQSSAQDFGFNWSDKEAKSRLDTFKETFEGVFSFKKKFDDILKSKEVVTNILGRPFMFKNTEEIYMKGFNRLIQGSGSDITLNSADRLRKMGFKVVLLVHDNIVVEIDDNNETAEKIKVIEKTLLDYSLNTSYGKLNLKVEGTISNQWK